MHCPNPSVLIALFFIMGSGYLFSQKPSPFKNPNTQVRQRSFPKPKFSPPNLAQKPNKQEDHSKEVEFRGYFYLNGKPRFCLFNVQAQFSEWVPLGGATVEDFNAIGFHEESETLTVAYKNHPEFNLNLYGPSSSPSLTTPSLPRRAPSVGRQPVQVSRQPKVMPPVPQFKPALPPSVVGTRSQLQTVGSPRSSSPPSPFGTRVPTPSRFPSLPGPGLPRFNTGQRVPAPTAPSSPSSPFSTRPAISIPSSSLPGSSPDTTPSPTPNPVTENELDLLNLPPPPPPPNILPPSAPPNIEPSREGE
jgi:hypothetical protein